VFMVGVLNLLSANSAPALVSGLFWIGLGGWAFTTRFIKLRKVRKP